MDLCGCHIRPHCLNSLLSASAFLDNGTTILTFFRSKEFIMHGMNMSRHSSAQQSQVHRKWGRLHELRILNIRKRMLLQMCRAERHIRVLAAEPESGMATAEYAVVLIAATGFAGLLVAILKSGAVKSLLTELVNRALAV